MNEKFRLLAEQCGGFPCSQDEWRFYNKDLEKFAELIVQECASMARVYCSHEFDFTGDLELDEFMLQHFGIEE